MKTNIRLFVPTTTEALDFEYGLLIHYMSYNEYRAQSEIGVQYYELAEIDPIDHALDVVQQQIITDAARSQSKIDGFTLDSHYTLSFDQRFNNKIIQDSVRQVWLWLNCKNSTEYHFLLEKITDFEEKRVSDQNQLLVRLWVHPDWTEQDINPFDKGKIFSYLELISVMKQRLSVQFDHIEQVSRQKVLASLNIKQTQPIVIKSEVAASAVEYKTKPIDRKIFDSTESSVNYDNLVREMQKSIKTVDQVELRLNNLKIELDKIKNSMISIDNIFLERSSECVIYIQNSIQKMIVDKENFYGMKKNSETFAYTLINFLRILEKLLSFDMHEEMRKDLVQSIIKNQKIRTAADSDTVVEDTQPILISDEQHIEKNQENFATWWIWPVIILIGFTMDGRLGVGLVVIAIFWYTLKFIFNSPILLFILIAIFAFGFFFS